MKCKFCDRSKEHHSIKGQCFVGKTTYEGSSLHRTLAETFFEPSEPEAAPAVEPQKVCESCRKMHPVGRRMCDFSPEAESTHPELCLAVMSGHQALPGDENGNTLIRCQLLKGHEKDGSRCSNNPRPETPPSEVTIKTKVSFPLSGERYNQLTGLEKRVHDWRLGWDKCEEYKTLLQMVAMVLAWHLSAGEGLIGPIAATEPYQEAALTALVVILRGVESPLALPKLLKNMEDWKAEASVQQEPRSGLPTLQDRFDESQKKLKNTAFLMEQYRAERDSACNKLELLQSQAAPRTQERDSALLEAAGLVCADCAKGLPSVKDTDGDWIHTGGDANAWLCSAGPIHERRALKGNG